MKVPSWPVVVSLALSLVGAILCAALLKAHVDVGGGGLLAQICGGEGEGCDKVVNSRWGVFPPGPPEGSERRSTRASIPVAALGLFYFSAVAVWFGAIGRPSRSRRWMHRALLVLCGLGCLGSIWFVVLMAAVIKTWCPLCLASHVCNFAVLGAVVFARPTVAGAESAAVYPPTRSALLAAALVVVLCVAEWSTYQAYRFGSEATKLREDGEWLEAIYYGRTKQNIEIRDDDPILPALPGLRNTVVFFSDIECPSCARFDRRLFEEILPLYEGHLRVVFKHYPLGERTHPNALAAAKAVEAARVQGKFWQMHDALLERREQLGVVKYADVAESLGMDRQRFLVDMSSPRTLERIQADKKHGAALGVRGTPGVFLNGRLLDRSFRDLMAFWRKRAAQLRKTREEGGVGWGATAKRPPAPAPQLQAPPKRVP